MSDKETRFHGFTGTDLNILRRNLALTQDNFAKHMNVNVKLIRKAERLKGKEIPIDGEFHTLFEHMCYAIPEMVQIRFDHLNSIQRAIQGVAVKLKRVDNWFILEKKAKDKPTPEPKKEDKKEWRQLSDTGRDKRSVSLNEE